MAWIGGESQQQGSSSSSSSNSSRHHMRNPAVQVCFRESILVAVICKTYRFACAPKCSPLHPFEIIPLENLAN